MKLLINKVYVPLFGMLFICCTLLAQEKVDTAKNLSLDSTFLDEMRCYLDCTYGEYPIIANQSNEYAGAIPTFSDSIYQERVEKLDKTTPIELQFNQDVLSYIKFYVTRRRTYTKTAMGRSAYYFPLFEEELDKHQMPLELKYLPVIESALNPTARSRAGAVGLWQFMYRTGKKYGLRVNSTVDERRDPFLSTKAACLHLKYLYELYHDWALVLAAYNAGQGNVNKAIRRAGGGKKTYWQVRRFLPRETRSYVPSFIAVIYAMHYSEEHKIDSSPFILDDKLQVDTVQVSSSLALKNASNYLQIPEKQMQYLNPSYHRGNLLLKDGKAHVYLPMDKIDDFFIYQDSIFSAKMEPLQEQTYTYIVRKGDYLGRIAKSNQCRVSQLKEWNNLRSDRLSVGQRLIIYSKN